MTRRITGRVWTLGAAIGAATMVVAANARAEGEEYDADTAANAQPPGPSSNPLGEPPVTGPLGVERPPANEPFLRVTKRPLVTIDVGGGILGYMGSAAKIGPVWNVRVTGLLGDRWGIEGNYSGSIDDRNSITSPAVGHLVMTAVDLDGRLNLVRADQAFVQPYVAAGIGWAAFSGTDGDNFTITVPVSVGAERMLTDEIKVGARFNFRPAFADNLGFPGQSSPPGADTWSVLANLGGAF